jgi:hypothetical protein
MLPEWLREVWFPVLMMKGHGNQTGGIDFTATGGLGDCGRGKGRNPDGAGVG